VICGGSYDNPMRAVQTSTKGVYRKRGGSNAVGFRCVQDIDPADASITARAKTATALAEGTTA
jgi:hypothetical protein